MSIRCSRANCRQSERAGWIATYMDENAHTGFGESYAIVADALSNKGSTQTGKLVFKATKYRNAK